MYDSQKVVIGGIISEISVKYTKNNTVMAFVNIEDLDGIIEVIMFPDVYSKYSQSLTEDSVVLISGRVSVSDDQPTKVICESITDYDDIINKNQTLWLKISKDSNIKLDMIMEILKNKKGKSPVIIYDEGKKQKITLKSSNYIYVDEMLIDELKKLLGEKSVVLKS